MTLTSRAPCEWCSHATMMQAIPEAAGLLLRVRAPRSTPPSLPRSPPDVRSRSTAEASRTDLTAAIQEHRSAGGVRIGHGRPQQEQRDGHRQPRRPGGGAGARLRLRPEHVAAGRARAGRAATGWCCSTTSAPAARTSSAWTADRYAQPRRLRQGRPGDLRRTGPARRGVRRPLGQRDDRGARRARPSRSRFAGAGMVAPSPCYIDDRAATAAGSAPRTSTSCWSRWTSNYLGWSAAMAPVIMGNPGAARARRGADQQLLRHRPGIARVFARTTFLSDNRADLAVGDRCRPWYWSAPRT